MLISSLHITILNSTLVHILVLGLFGFMLCMVLTPLYTTAAYKWQWWKHQRVES